MSSQNPKLPDRQRVSGNAAVEPHAEPCESLEGPISPDRLQYWADLVISRRIEFPGHLAPNDERRLVTEVRRRNRSGLVQFVARAIARDIQDGMKNLHGGSQE